MVLSTINRRRLLYQLWNSSGNHSYRHGQLRSTSKLLDVDLRQREDDVQPRKWLRRGGEETRLARGSSLPLCRSLYSPPNHRLHSSSSQIPHLLPHSSRLSHLQKPLPPLVSESISRRYCSGGDSVTDSDADGEFSDNGGADPAEVDKVCKVINELFLLDRNMESVLDECGINLSHDLVVDVLERFRHARKPAMRFFFWAGQRKGFSHDSRTCNAMMSILAKTRQLETMVSMLEDMGEKGLLTMDTFLIAMRAFAAAKERKKAIGMFELMKKYKFKLGAETLNSLLDCLGRAKLAKEAKVLFSRLEHRFTPNLRTYTVLLNGWCKVKNLMEAGRVWNEMIEKGFKPDVVAHNIMLEGLLKSRKRSDAIKLFEIMKAKGPAPDVFSYTILIRYLCKQGRMEEVIDYYDEMADSGCDPDAAVYTCLISGFGNQRKMDKVFELLTEMKEKGCPPDAQTYNALIKLMVRRRLPDDAVKVYKKMIQNGMEPTIHSYNMIMKSYFFIRNYEMGCAVWDEMIGRGCCPDDNSYTVLIRGLVSQGRSADACKYLEEMMEKGMKMPQLDYNRFVADMSKAGSPAAFEALAQKMNFGSRINRHGVASERSMGVPEEHEYSCYNHSGG
ncbi:Pentatricopeptide repeat-containing protein At3g62470, mitochondrial [Linum grandiflorum]